MRIILLAAPGAGKGTVAKRLSAHTGATHIATGDLLRRAVKAATPFGEKVRKYMNTGELVPDDLILELITQTFEQDPTQGFLLDGFPRTRPQAEALEALFTRLGITLDLVANLAVPEAVILDRLSTRRTCSNIACQEIYNVKSKPAGPGDTCLKCGSPVVQRPDETVAAITLRLGLYHQLTEPLVAYYRDKGMLKVIDDLDTDKVEAAILAGVGISSTGVSGCR